MIRFGRADARPTGGQDAAIFTHRTVVYEQARSKHLKHGSRQIRKWSLHYEVWLNRPAVGHRNRLVPEKTVRKGIP